MYERHSGNTGKNCEFNQITRKKLTYNNSDGGTYRNEWRQDPVSREWIGNPASEAGVEDLMKALKHKQGADGNERHHSQAMRYEHMEGIIRWSEHACPAISELTSEEEVNEQFEHLRLCAFASTAFTIWTR